MVEPNAVGGFTELRYRLPRVRRHHLAAAGLDGPDNAFINLREVAGPTVEVAGCPDCGSRELPVADLLGAFDRGRSSISV